MNTSERLALVSVPLVLGLLKRLMKKAGPIVRRKLREALVDLIQESHSADLSLLGRPRLADRAEPNDNHEGRT